MMMVPKSLTKINLFPIQASMLPQGMAKTSAFQASGQNINSVISHNPESNDSGLTTRQQANSEQVNPGSSRSSKNTGMMSESSINRIKKQAQLAAERMLSAYTVQAVSPPIENKPEELITQATSSTALSNSRWPIAYPSSTASTMLLNSQQLSTTQAASHLNQAQATSALPFTGSIPKESHPLPANNLGFPNAWNSLNPYQYHNTPSAAMHGISPVPTERPVNSHAMPFFSPFGLNLAGKASRLPHLRRKHPVVGRKMTEKTASTSLFNGLQRVIQEIAKTCGCCGFTEKTAVPVMTGLSAQSRIANTHLLNNNSYDKTTTME